jgi:hypothetical protein
MKWINGFTKEEKRRREKLEEERLKEWHEYFALEPVVVGVTEDKREIKVWLKTVMRKGTLHKPDHIQNWWRPFWSWEYREKV